MAGPHESRLRTTAYRHSAPHLAEIGPELLEGSRRVGGRFNPRGEFGVLYVSLDRETTRAELGRRAQRAGVELDDLLPRSIVVVRLDLHR
ncbi:MAG: RES domain-containing protein, partial [Gemmatimonadota bacterium]